MVFDFEDAIDRPMHDSDSSDDEDSGKNYGGPNWASSTTTTSSSTFDDDDDTSNDEQVQVRFTTTLPEQYQVPDSSILVPARLSRYGLSEVINLILELGMFMVVIDDAK
jgi:hypothetical protein